MAVKFQGFTKLHSDEVKEVLNRCFFLDTYPRRAIIDEAYRIENKYSGGKFLIKGKFVRRGTLRKPPPNHRYWQYRFKVDGVEIYGLAHTFIAYKVLGHQPLFGVDHIPGVYPNETLGQINDLKVLDLDAHCVENGWTRSNRRKIPYAYEKDKLKIGPKKGKLVYEFQCPTLGFYKTAHGKKEAMRISKECVEQLQIAVVESMIRGHKERDVSIIDHDFYINKYRGWGIDITSRKWRKFYRDC